ncbi:anhydro-N-acetylmuramic acid kinase [Undibacterium sp. LX40W]|uniref:Anhydro-N-acetylmuramic acid kinase n=1 Tax=Undibacterium nitidum TaxID=2762298 RepID=A0A923HNJ9_9BURK|nr:anhydro-N-acetylmuramic acid kinase [Undibacterium nitidum]MBC3881668.1 anhydro-N-acetylmuramic acid kinase [Undibacterium nitidum]MBC3891549.1 anhydro-N-acetylmuramic acid kinase [Undibacterium sp. LX40W]
MSELTSSIYIGLMSGTSLDGVDGVLVQLPEQAGAPMEIIANAHIPFHSGIRSQALALQQNGEDEIHREALLANAVTQIYAQCVRQLMQNASGSKVSAIGVHGQTIRHRPELGYTRQTNNPALLAELTCIDVIADFRSRDVAAGGQGAPLVPAFHRAIFGSLGKCRVVVNIGGISNISVLRADGSTVGFDTGPGNVLMDGWIERHQGQTYDADGVWANQGAVHDALLVRLYDEPFLQLPPPKSTGRDLFRMHWLDQILQEFASVSPVDVQATLCAFTAKTIADQIRHHAGGVSEIYVCGGGVFNATLMRNLGQELSPVPVKSTAELGVAPEQVEALAFAWLAQCFVQRRPGNLAEVTGARGERILGALYPA